MSELRISRYPAKATAYWPKDVKTAKERQMEGKPVDRCDFPLYTVEEHLAGKAPYVSVAMDNDAFPYGTALYIPEICEAFGVPWDEITFLVVDTGGAFIKPDIRDRSRIDICVLRRLNGLKKIGNMKPVTLCVMEIKS